MRCAIFGCNSDNQSKSFSGDVKFFSFPKDPAMRKLWLSSCRRSDTVNAENARICSKHFSADDYQRNLRYELLNYIPKNGKRLLKVHAVPSLFLPKGKSKQSEGTRKQRLLKRRPVKLVQSIIESSENRDIADTVQEELCTNLDTPCSSRSVGINTDYEENPSSRTVSELRKKIEILENKKKIFESLFTENQIQKLTNPESRPKWTVEEISQAISIYSAGPLVYRMLLKKGYPFPAVSTLRTWARRIKILPGILKQVVKIMKNVELSQIEKICVLSFDKMKVRKVFCYDKTNDETLKQYDYVQVVMIQGLVGNWKQPVYFDFDCAMTEILLRKIIEHIESAGFYVCGIVSDLCGSNRSLYTSLGISSSEPWFWSTTQEDVEKHKIFVFADVPHLLKLIRNNFIGNGFIINGKEINKEIIEKLLTLTSNSDLRITHKISIDDLRVKGTNRQNVKLAAKLFSHTVSQAINRCGMLGYFTEEENWLECANFFKQVNDWFDCLNSKVPEQHSRDRMKAFGCELETQEKILNDMSKTISEMVVKGKASLMSFQEGILQTNNALKLMYDDLKTRFGLRYLLTYKLNEDVLENFFGVMRAKGGLYDHPDPLEFRHRLRSYILGRHYGNLSNAGNTEEDSTPHAEDLLLTGKPLSMLTDKNSTDQDPVSVDEDIGDIDELKYDSLEHLGGFICKRLKTNPESTTSSTYTWTDQLSEGGLIKPPEELTKNMEQLENIFNNFNDDTIKITKNYFKTLLSLSTNVECEDKIKKIFFKSRLYFRIRYLNQKANDNSNSEI